MDLDGIWVGTIMHPDVHQGLGICSDCFRCSRKSEGINRGSGPLNFKMRNSNLVNRENHKNVLCPVPALYTFVMYPNPLKPPECLILLGMPLQSEVNGS